MNKIKIIIAIIVLLSLSLLACTMDKQPSINTPEDDFEKTQESKQFDADVETAVFETTVVRMLTEQAPTITLTFTPSPVPTETPIPTMTATITPTIWEDPWLLQDRCEPFKGSGCVKYMIDNLYNKTWQHVHLIFLDTGEEGYFYIRPKTVGAIKLIPGKYKATYIGWCDGEMSTVTKYWTVDSWIDKFTCHKTKGLRFWERTYKQ